MYIVVYIESENKKNLYNIIKEWCDNNKLFASKSEHK